jgi:uncharacterized membrane protein YheB (UPF0754 family)
MTAAFIIIPLLSAFLGWFIIKMSIYMLFHPAEATRVGPFTVQGAYYKNETAIKAAVVTVIKKELAATNNLAEQLTSPANLEKLKPEIEEHIDFFLKVKLKEAMPMIGMLIGDRTTSQLKLLFMQEMESLFPHVMKSYVNHIKADDAFERLINTRLSAITPAIAEKKFFSHAAPELRKLQWVAAFTGFLAGCIQLLVIIFLVP